MYRSKEEWMKLLGELGILWFHDDNWVRPHALLTSGFHSNGFINASLLVFSHPRLAREFCVDFVEYDLKPMLNLTERTDILRADLAGGVLPDLVIGPAFGAITIARDIADALDIGFCFTVPEGAGDSKKFALEKRFSIKDKLVLATEDVITTGDSVGKSTAVAKENGANVLPFYTALFNRSGMHVIDGKPIVAMIDKSMPTWPPEKCPYCRKGSRAIRPKEADNWKLLNAAY